MGTEYGKADLNPAEWKWMGCFYRGDSDEMQWVYRDDHAELAENLTGDPYASWEEIFDGVNFHENGGCASCGAHFAHGAVYERTPTERIAVGHTCGAEYFGLDSIAALRTKQASESRERRKLREAWEAQLADNPKFAAAIEWGKGDDESGERDSFIADVARRGRQYGGATERQIEAVIRAHAKGLEWEAEKARRAAADAEAESCPEGKQTITGTILSSDYRENTFSYYGEMIPKMLVRDDRGFKVWGTVPRVLMTRKVDGHVISGLPEKGERVTFTATIEPSRDDRLFGFFKRPSKAERLES